MNFIINRGSRQNVCDRDRSRVLHTDVKMAHLFSNSKMGHFDAKKPIFVFGHQNRPFRLSDIDLRSRGGPQRQMVHF